MSKVFTRRFSCALIAAALAILVSVPAYAHLQTKSDPDDTEGALDIRSSSFGHTDTKFKLTLTTQGNWTVKGLSAGEEGHNQFQFFLDSKGNDSTDYFIDVDNYDGELKAKLFNGMGKFLSYLPAFKDGKTAGTKFSKSKVHPRASHVNWSAFSKSVGGSCPSICADYSPGKGMYRHNL